MAQYQYSITFLSPAFCLCNVVKSYTLNYGSTFFTGGFKSISCASHGGLGSATVISYLAHQSSW